MNDREKLIALIENAKRAMKSENLSCNIARNGFVADFLIANGVTIQRWIPVDERLPEKQVDVVALSNKNGGYMFAGYRGYISGEWMENGAMHIGDVTHWMPLPQPPKEVE